MSDGSFRVLSSIIVTTNFIAVMTTLDKKETHLCDYPNQKTNIIDHGKCIKNILKSPDECTNRSK